MRLTLFVLEVFVCSALVRKEHLSFLLPLESIHIKIEISPEINEIKNETNG